MEKQATANTLDVIQRYLTALGQRDLENILQLFANQVDWFIPGNIDLAPWLGKRTNKQEIRSFFNHLWAETEPITAKIDHIIANDNFGVVTGEFSTRMLRTNKIYHSIFSIHFTLENQLITNYRLQEDSYALVTALTD